MRFMFVVLCVMLAGCTFTCSPIIYQNNENSNNSDVKKENEGILKKE